MAAKGAAAKEQIIQKLLDTFEGSFKYDKEIRIPIMENGELLQIKCTLTCAKSNVEGGTGAVASNQSSNDNKQTDLSNFMQEPTEEEKERVRDLCDKIGVPRG